MLKRLIERFVRWACPRPTRITIDASVPGSMWLYIRDKRTGALVSKQKVSEIPGGVTWLPPRCTVSVHYAVATGKPTVRFRSAVTPDERQ